MFFLVFRRELQWTKWCHSYVDGLARGPRLERRRQAVQTQAAKVPNVVAGWVFYSAAPKIQGEQKQSTHFQFNIEHAHAYAPMKVFAPLLVLPGIA